VFQPQPPGIGGGAFLEPDVLPVLQADAVAKPLVGQFMRYDVFRQGIFVSSVLRKRLGFHGEDEERSITREIYDDNAIGIEGIGTKALAKESQHVRCLVYIAF